MINTKQGTVAWSPNAKETFTAERPAVQTQTMSVDDREKALGGNQNVGDMLNKVADANYVDPAKARKPGNNQLDKDAFLKLMLAQMKYQDPTNPMQNHEMAAQLAQFTSLEQLNNINSTLTGMSKTQAPQVNYQALNFIGKKVSGDSSKVARVNGDTNHEFHFELSNEAAKADVKVLDADGNLVRKMPMGNLKKGSNAITWNGMNDDGTSARPGDYHFAVEAQSSNGAKVYVKTEFNGKITGLNYTAQGPVLLVGQQAIRLQDVKKIEESTGEAVQPQMMQQQPMQNVPLGARGPGVMPSAMQAMGALPAGMSPEMVAGMMPPGMSMTPPASSLGLPPITNAPVPAKDPEIRDQMVKNVAMSRAVLDQVAKAKAASSSLDDEGKL